MIKNLPASAEDIKSKGSILGWEDPLEEVIATHSSIHAWRIPWTEEPGGLQSMGSHRVEQDLSTKQQKNMNIHAYVNIHRYLLDMSLDY